MEAHTCPQPLMLRGAEAGREVGTGASCGRLRGAQSQRGRTAGSVGRVSTGRRAEKGSEILHRICGGIARGVFLVEAHDGHGQFGCPLVKSELRVHA